MGYETVWGRGWGAGGAVRFKSDTLTFCQCRPKQSETLTWRLWPEEPRVLLCDCQIRRPECQRVIGGRRAGDARPNQRLALRYDYLAFSLCQANRGVKLAAKAGVSDTTSAEKRSILATKCLTCFLSFFFFLLFPFRRSRDQVQFLKKFQTGE